MSKANTMGDLIANLIDQYDETFHTSIPLKWMGLSDEETVELLVNCLTKNEPYRSDFPKGAIL